MYRQHERLALPAQPESVTAARHFLTLTLTAWGLTALIDKVALAVSEVLTNAVVHAQTALEVDMHVGEQLVVSVRDGSPPWAALPLGAVASTLPEWDSEGGRGLALVQAVTDAWGVCPEHLGKTVWFTLDLPRQP